MFAFFKKNKGFNSPLLPEQLPGVKKKSFILPYNGGEIWFEHLDGMYQYTELVLSNLKQDAEVFSIPSKPGVIGFVLNETVINQTVVDAIEEVLCNGTKCYRKVAFIGTNWQIKRSIKRVFYGKSDFLIGFFEDFELAKEWLISGNKPI